MEGADIYQIAKNCRTSVEMIEKYYASHIKNSLDAAAINVTDQETDRRRQQRAGHPKKTAAKSLSAHSSWLSISCRLYVDSVRGRGGIGRRNGLKRKFECLTGKPARAELLKFGEPCTHGDPEPSPRSNPVRKV